MLGDKAAGKTSLINRYVRHKFSQHRQVDPQTGMVPPFVTKTEEVPWRSNNNASSAARVVLKIYDDPPGALKLLKQLASAQEDCGGSTICIVVLDLAGGQSTFEKCKRIAAKVLDLAGVTVAIAGNKADLVGGEGDANHSNAESIAMMEEYAKSKNAAFFQVSAKTNASVERMFQEVAGTQTEAIRAEGGRQKAPKANNGGGAAQTAGKKGPKDGQHYFKEIVNQKKQGEVRGEASVVRMNVDNLET